MAINCSVSCLLATVHLVNPSRIACQPIKNFLGFSVMFPALKFLYLLLPSSHHKCLIAIFMSQINCHFRIPILCLLTLSNNALNYLKHPSNYFTTTATTFNHSN